MNRGLLVAFLASCLLAGATVVGATTVMTAVGAEASPAETFAQEDVDPDNVLMTVAVEDDGDATWTVEYRMRLATTEDREAFDELREDIESNPEPYVERFQERMDATAANAEEATGREMEITEMSVAVERHEFPRERGVVAYTFRWSNFAHREGDRLVVGDAIDGLFLEEDTALTVSWSETYELVGVTPEPFQTRERSVTWQGPTNFPSGGPRVELEPPGAAFTLPLTLAAGAALVVLLAVAGAGAFVAYRRRGGIGPLAAGDSDDGGPDADAEGPPADEELLSNEEQVLRLVERNGGRMKQKRVAEELGWTDAKTSQVTKKLREEGELEGFRLGRENVLSLPGDDRSGDQDGAGGEA